MYKRQANTNGFTLMDMVSYDTKHNEANGEENRDGTDYNQSWNCLLYTSEMARKRFTFTLTESEEADD